MKGKFAFQRFFGIIAFSICVSCHAEQPGHGHLLLENEPRYQEFMRKYGKQWKRLHTYLNFD